MEATDCLYVENVHIGLAQSKTLQAISTYKTRFNTYQLSPQLDAPLPHTKWLPTRDIGFVMEVSNNTTKGAHMVSILG